LVVAGLIRLSREDRVRRRVARYVARIHHQSWYCGRCGGVFFRPGTVPAHVPTNVLIPAADFRDTVWLHGYHHWRIEHAKPTTAPDGGR
jgi:hypothetical protein